MCAKVESQVGEAIDDGACFRCGEAFAFAGLIGVADAVDAGEAGGLDVSHRVADERAFARFGVEGVHGLGNQMWAGFEERGIVAGPRDDEADSVV